MYKVGRSSGTTIGVVNGVCSNIMGTEDYTFRLCSTVVAASGLRGDSGSPVFSLSSSGGVSLYTPVGLLWGIGSRLGAGTVEYAFSPISNIVSELPLGCFSINGGGGSCNTVAP